MGKKGKFVDQLSYSLNNFDLHSAISLVDRIEEAELEEDYELNTKESRLLERLLTCIASYKRNLYGL